MKVGGRPYATALYQGDIDEAVVKVQRATGVFIDKTWWDKNVGDKGEPMEILDRFDDAYAKYIDSIPNKEPDVTQEMIDALPPPPDYNSKEFLQKVRDDIASGNIKIPEDQQPPPGQDDMPPDSNQPPLA